MFTLRTALYAALVGALFFLAGSLPASAGSWAGQAQGVTAYERIVYSFTSADIASDAATTFRVGSSEALFCFNADTAGAPAGTAQVQPRLYPTGDTTHASVALGGANGNSYLTGTGGPATSQNACIWIGPGVYSLDIQVACGAGDACAVSVQGAGAER